MIGVSKAVLKSKMLEYFRNVERTGEELIVTDHRRPVLRVVPIKSDQPLREVFAEYQGKATFISSPVEPETDEWGELGA
jgi:antitoxin (DNA-binding transcriptional repressor) of toxin-antitoxin stability system